MENTVLIDSNNNIDTFLINSFAVIWYFVKSLNVKV